MNIFSKVINSLEKVFKSGKVNNALEQVAQLAVAAAPIVSAIEVLVPSNNRTVQAIEKAYDHYAVPVSLQIVNDPTSINNALMNLASAVLAKNLPSDKAGVATNVLNTAVQLAVTALKAK